MKTRNTGKVMTVMGLIDPEQLGHTITHEHLYFDLTGYRAANPTPEQIRFYEEPVILRNLNRVRKDAYGTRDNCIHLDRSVALREIAAFKSHGGMTICDVSPGGVKEGVMEKYVPRLVDLANASGINIVAGFGHYIYNINDTCETEITLGKRLPEIKDMTPERLAEDYIDAIVNGFGDTGIRPGMIGELGTGYQIHPEEAKVLRAAAIAQSETGLPITLHMHAPSRNGQEALDILEEYGARLDKVVMGHSDGVLAHPDIEFADAVDYYSGLAERGAYVEFDLCGNGEYFITDEGEWWLPSDRERAKAIARLCERGYSDQILLSHDTGHKYYLLEYGGWGYAHALDGFHKTLLRSNIDPAIIDKFTIDNPKRMLTIF